MRAPKRKRPMRRAPVLPPGGVDLGEVAANVRYVGSGEHKSFPSFAGPPRLRSDATKCDPSMADAAELTDWLRQGITTGWVGAPWEGGYPRYVWYRSVIGCFEGRLVNAGAGEYKGYPLSEDEWPRGL